MSATVAARPPARPAEPWTPLGLAAAGAVVECTVCRGHRGRLGFGRFGHFFGCADCGAQTVLRFDCGPNHWPHLRQEGGQLYRDCEQCGDSQPLRLMMRAVAA